MRRIFVVKENFKFMIGDLNCGKRCFVIIVMGFVNKGKRYGSSYSLRKF